MLLNIFDSLAGPEVSHGPRLVGQILSELFEHGNDDFARAWRQHMSNSFEKKGGDAI